jgi:hypothetical protein
VSGVSSQVLDRSVDRHVEVDRSPDIAVTSPPNMALQSDNGKLSCLLHPQTSRQLAFAAEVSR